VSQRPLFRAGIAALAICLASCSRVKTQAALPAPPAREAGLHEDNPFEAAEYFREQRVMGDGLLPIERYQAALAHASTMRRYSLREGRFVDPAPRAAATFGTWESLGPGNVGGRTRGLAIDPQNTNIMWAGGATGGLWKTTDGGQTWTPVDDFAPVLAINCLVMDPHDPNTIYACTGEQTQNWRGAGIYKTSDGGDSWTQLPATTTSDFYFVNNLAISPASSSHLYAATNTGLWASLDGGNTWNLSLASPDGGPAATRTGGTTNGCFDTLVQSNLVQSNIVEPGQSTDAVFAVCHPPGSLLYAVFRNSDAAGAGSWAVVLSDPNMWYTVLAAAPSQPGTIYAVSVTYASTGAYYRALLAVYRSTSGGTAGSWVTQTNQSSGRLNSAILSIDSAYNFGATFCSESAASVNFNGQAGYNLAVAVDPLDPNRVWAAGIGLFRSDDGGVTWGYAFVNDHPDQHGLVFDPGYDGNANQTLYNISDGGIYKTTQARGQTGTCANTSSTVIWTPLNNQYVTTQFYHGVPYPGGAAFFGGTQEVHRRRLHLRERHRGHHRKLQQLPVHRLVRLRPQQFAAPLHRGDATVADRERHGRLDRRERAHRPGGWQHRQHSRHRGIALRRQPGAIRHALRQDLQQQQRAYGRRRHRLELHYAARRQCGAPGVRPQPAQHRLRHLHHLQLRAGR
jgi:photosystem II stability/assembly factor-like uncharacterized protein